MGYFYRFLSGAVLAAVGSTAFAVSDVPVPFVVSQTQGDFQVAVNISAIRAGFGRRNAVLDARGLQPAALATATGLFPSYGFAPSATGLAWDIQVVDVDHSQLGVAIIVSSLSSWRGAVRGLTLAGMRPATSSYTSAMAYVMPLSYPATVYGSQILDRRDTVVPVVLPTAFTMSGFDTTAKVTPSVVLSTPVRESTSTTLSLQSTLLMPMSKGDPVPLVSITGITLREGFTVVHNCVDVQPSATCALTLTYTGGTSPVKVVANMRLTLSTGDFAVVSLLGITKEQ